MLNRRSFIQSCISSLALSSFNIKSKPKTIEKLFISDECILDIKNWSSDSLTFPLSYLLPQEFKHKIEIQND